MKSVRMPLAYFGSIGYYQKFFLADDVCFEVKEHYIKQTLRNRIYILGPNRVLSLSIPIIKIHGSKTAMDEIIISYKEEWWKEHLKALETAYSSSPFFEYYWFELKPFYYQKTNKLVDFDQQCHQMITKWLSLEKDVNFSKNYDLKEHEIDLRAEKGLPNNKVSYSYQQVIMKNRTFEGNLSILDAIFNLGPMARNIIVNK